MLKARQCIYCNKPLSGRSDKIYCNQYCKSAQQYEKKKTNESQYLLIDRQLKKNRVLLKQYNKAGKTIIRQSVLLDNGFNPKFYTHRWKSSKGKIYFFCYEFGFMPIIDNQKEKYLLIQWQNFMNI